MGARLKAVETRRKSYLRRKPQSTVLYRVLQQDLETFLAELDVGDRRLPSFVERELRPDLLEAACKAAEHPLTLHRLPGYDHSYYFIASFIDEHMAHHAAALFQ